VDVMAENCLLKADEVYLFLFITFTFIYLHFYKAVKYRVSSLNPHVMFPGSSTKTMLIFNHILLYPIQQRQQYYALIHIN